MTTKKKKDKRKERWKEYRLVGHEEGSWKHQRRTKSSYRYWTEGKCRQESRKYEYRQEFRKKSPSAYQIAARNGWLESYTWLKYMTRKWDEESVMEEAKKYYTQGEFMRGNRSAFNYAYKNRLIEKMDWFIKMDDEMDAFMRRVMGDVRRVGLKDGLDAAKEWLLGESMKGEEYTSDQCKMFIVLYRRVNEKWFTWKKKMWYLYPDMDYKKILASLETEEEREEFLRNQKDYYGGIFPKPNV